jgi:hypothetical protein
MVVEEDEAETDDGDSTVTKNLSGMSRNTGMITCVSQNFEKFVEKNDIFCQKSLNIENQTFEVLKKISMQNDTLISQNNELKELLKIKNDPFGLNINHESILLNKSH